MEQLGWPPNEISTVKNKGMPHMTTCILHTLYHVHIEQDADSKENWKLSRTVQETDGTEKVYAAHSLASKFNSQQR